MRTQRLGSQKCNKNTQTSQTTSSRWPMLPQTFRRKEDTHNGKSLRSHWGPQEWRKLLYQRHLHWPYISLQSLLDRAFWELYKRNPSSKESQSEIRQHIVSFTEGGNCSQHKKEGTHQLSLLKGLTITASGISNTSPDDALLIMWKLDPVCLC